MRLLLVDGHYYLYRSFFAIRGLSNSRGEPTNAIYGFAKALRRMLVDVKPTQAAVIWDCGIPARRTELQPAYKQNRTAMPDDLRPQETWLMDKVSLFGPASLCAPNTEADDLIASYAKQAESEGAEVVIATNDKDIMQMVSPLVKIYSTVAKALPGVDAFNLLGPAEVEVKWGVPPRGIGEVLALTGDSSDNIPGVGGVGGKTAAALVREYGTVQVLLENLDRPPAKLAEKLRAGRDQVLSNRQMVALDEDLPLPLPWTDLLICPRYAELIEALKACEFKGLLKEVEEEAAKTPVQTQGDLFG